MASFQRTASAEWHGSGPEGAGSLSGPSGVLDNTPYSANLRFQNEDGRAGTNPEELIAAAHAGCYSMALSFGLTNGGFTPDELRCSATIQMEKTDAGWTFAKITLRLEARVPGISAEQFLEFAQKAKAGCPVSRALAAVPIELDATLL
ncbi:MAG: OsmC family protein [Saprospirales bacterium]|nr:OsmC family protein [Saprospirales bacterium]